jgi:uncharacterized membrane protein YfcA
MIDTFTQSVEILGVGFAAGLIGGLAGIGGSLIMLPALHFILGEPRTTTHHLYMAAAMMVNVAVSLPAAWRHSRSGRIDRDALPTLLVSTIIAIIGGVFAGNAFDGSTLKLMLAAFIAIYCLFNLWRLFSRAGDSADTLLTPSRPKLIVSGLSTGFVGGVLGLGGGVMLVPLLQMLCKVELKRAIATSSAVICMTAVVGAGIKLATLSNEHESWRNALHLALFLAPTAIIGGFIGASLTHILPTRAVRIVVTIVLALSALRLAGVFR